MIVLHLLLWWHHCELAVKGLSFSLRGNLLEWFVTKCLPLLDRETPNSSASIESSICWHCICTFKPLRQTPIHFTPIFFLYFGRQSRISYIWELFTCKSCLQENIVQDPRAKRGIVMDKIKRMFVRGMKFLPTLVSSVTLLAICLSDIEVQYHHSNWDFKRDLGLACCALLKV